MTISDARSANDGTADRPPQSLPGGKDGIDPGDPTAAPAADDTSRAEVQRAITLIWEAVLRLDNLAADDDFFEMGGHSLAASQVISRMRESLQVEVSLGAFFDSPSIAELTALVMRLKTRSDTSGSDTEKAGR